MCRLYLQVSIYLMILVFALPQAKSAYKECRLVLQSVIADVGSGKKRIETTNPYLVNNDFTVSRRLMTYSMQMPFVHTPTLQKMVEQLPPQSTWIDMGAGSGRALADGLTQNDNIAKGIAISYRRPLDTVDESALGDRFKYLDGDYVENMSLDGRLDHYVGKVDLITDMFGPLSYTEDFARVLQVYIDLLKTDGEMTFNLLSETNFKIVSGEFVVTEPKTGNTVIENGHVLREGLIAWLSNIPGLEVKEIVDYEFSQPSDSQGKFERSIGIKIRKINSDVRVPQNLRMRNYEPASPPIRIFEVLH